MNMYFVILVCNFYIVNILLKLRKIEYVFNYVNVDYYKVYVYVLGFW